MARKTHAVLYHGEMKANLLKRSMRLACLKRVCSQIGSCWRITLSQIGDFSNSTNLDILSLYDIISISADMKRYQYTVDQCFFLRLLSLMEERTHYKHVWIP